MGIYRGDATYGLEEENRLEEVTASPTEDQVSAASVDNTQSFASHGSVPQGSIFQPYLQQHQYLLERRDSVFDSAIPEIRMSKIRDLANRMGGHQPKANKHISEEWYTVYQASCHTGTKPGARRPMYPILLKVPPVSPFRDRQPSNIEHPALLAH
ncbi:hypothetical protein BDZ94DRAFT_1308623 [Collybia nuda]|uniref:Uncharacterized protein n=1 Tax=Collybia nuda TaxID=64659 RepID=A0A9P5Y7K1_9AGAR|nr:hypothetical protein BDZ94DRAFT_1308623 [Collybia nuda]